MLFLHWRIDAAAAERHMPKGVFVDTHGGEAYVGIVLVGFGWTRALGLVPLPFVGSFLQANVRIPSVDAEGRHGVTFIDVQAQRRVVALAGRLALQPANWTHATRLTGPSGEEHWRLDGQGGKAAHLEFTGTVGDPIEHGPLEHWLTDRWIGHVRAGDVAAGFRVRHEPWEFRSLIIRELRTTLLEQVGVPPGAAPDVPPLWSKGVVADVGLPFALED